MAKKTQYNITLFIFASLAALAVCGLLYIFLMIELHANRRSVPAGTDDKYFLNANRRIGDPLITDNPDLNEMITGPIISARDPDMGYDDAPVTIVEFSDFECGYCYKQEQAIKRLMQDYKYSIKLIWKDFPAADKESKSYQAALAARCAGEQDMFWPYHDFLFNSHGDLGREKYLEIARLLELNMDNFTACFDGEETENLVKDNMTEAQALDIVGVPFIFVNDQQVMGEASYTDLEKIVKSELDKVNKK